MANYRTLRLELASIDSDLAPAPVVIALDPSTVKQLLDVLGEEIGHFECDMLSPQGAMEKFRERLSHENFGHWKSKKPVDTLVFCITRDEGFLQIESSKNENRWITEDFTPGELPYDDYLHYTSVLSNRMLEFALNAQVHDSGVTQLRSSRKRRRYE
jgi:hypothetical protein